MSSGILLAAALKVLTALGSQGELSEAVTAKDAQVFERAGRIVAAQNGRRAKWSRYLDLMGLGLLIGQLVGRWGNFFNREAHGAETASLFRMGLYELNKETNLVELHYWHPTFLYESVWNLIGFVILHFVSKKRRKYDGQIFLMYVAWYGLGRLWIEGLRTDSLMIGPIRVSQLLAGVSFLAATAIMVWIHFKKHPDGSDMLVNRQKPAAEPDKSCNFC